MFLRSTGNLPLGERDNTEGLEVVASHGIDRLVSIIRCGSTAVNDQSELMLATQLFWVTLSSCSSADS